MLIFSPYALFAIPLGYLYIIVVCIKENHPFVASFFILAPIILLAWFGCSGFVCSHPVTSTL
jgi:hypothetical protein